MNVIFTKSCKRCVSIVNPILLHRISKLFRRILFEHPHETPVSGGVTVKNNPRKIIPLVCFGVRSYAKLYPLTGDWCVEM